MGLIHIKSRSSEDYNDFMDAIEMAKEAIDTICELTEEMEEQYGERGGGEYPGMPDSERSSQRMSRRYAQRSGMSQRRRRASNGQYM